MAIEVKVNENVDSEFPKLMKSGDVIIIATSVAGMLIHGTVVESNEYDVGHHRTDWLKGSFKDYNGEITLKNK